MMDEFEGLCKLADAYGIETGYIDSQGVWQTASQEAMLAILKILGVPIQNASQAGTFLKERVLAQKRISLQPVEVIWLEKDEDFVEIPLRLESTIPDQAFAATLRLENGKQLEWEFKLPELRVSSTEEFEDVRFITHQMELPAKIPVGYHHLEVKTGSSCLKCLLIASPVLAHGDHVGDKEKTWGIFLPLYAAKSERNLGAGDFQDLEALLEWTVSKGGKVVGTLPMLAAFLDEPFEYSPYSPASRLFWNEFYLAIEKIPELERNQPAKGLIQSAEFQKESARLRDADLVDYRGVMALKRKVLQLLADGFAETSTEARKDQFRSFIEGNPAVVDYARFRAAAEKFKTSWHTWPESFKIGNIDEKQLDSKAILYHQLVQWWCSEQMGALAKKAASLGANGLYLDLPLGVNADSYDVYRHRELFALGASGGAPPDGFFTLGQDWGFPPMLPEQMLRDGFSYLRSVLRHHMNSASSLRVDHVMGLHRLYWVPRGLGAKNGAYVRYPTEPLYAVFNLESVRHKTMVVGEDLGTVPEGVRPAMHRHGWHRLFVGQFEWNPHDGRVLNEAPKGAIASFNTHDLPTFAAFWTGKDIQDRLEMGLIGQETADFEKQNRFKLCDQVSRELKIQEFSSDNPLENAQEAYLGIIGELTQDNSQIALMNIEDLWGAVEPQNVPGIWREKPNWRHKAAFSVLEWDGVTGIGDVLEKLNQRNNR